MKYKIIEITTPFIKLDSFLKFTGTAETGGHAKVMVEQGDVKVNGEIATARGKKLVSGSKVECLGEFFEVVVVEG